MSVDQSTWRERGWDSGFGWASCASPEWLAKYLRVHDHDSNSVDAACLLCEALDQLMPSDVSCDSDEFEAGVRDGILAEARRRAN